MKKLVMKKPSRAQMKLSFGMIFSIMLIIFFLAFAFWGIKKFLCWQKDMQAISFSTDLQNDIDNLWKSTEGSRHVSYVVPRNVKEICFGDDSRVYLEPPGCSIEFGDFSIKNIDIGKIVGVGGRDYCIGTESGRVSMVLSKGYRDALVNIERG